MLRLDDSWVWDSWYAEDGGVHHVFFLRAPRLLGDPGLRHLRASVGHAVSTDLHEWTLMPDALAPADEPAWDDRAIWTGSVVRDSDGTWHMFYTGISRADGRTVQRIGSVSSDDLLNWTRTRTTPLIEADPAWYEAEPSNAWSEVAWRDPWVFPGPAGEGWHMLVTARSRHGTPRGRGVVGHAWSPDLVSWEARAPLSAPAGFGHLEVPQVFEMEGRWRLLFSCLPGEIAAERRRGRCRRGDVFLADAEGPLGPFDIRGAVPLPIPDVYAARIVRHAGEDLLIGFRDRDSHGFVGELCDPVPLRSLLTASRLLPYLDEAPGR
jgi:beta-fructofuranosidase